jgi:hypothetical protein
MRDFVGAENFSAALRFDLDGTPLRYVPSRSKPSGETKKFSVRRRCAKYSNVGRATEGVAEPWFRRALLHLPITTAQFLLVEFSVQVCGEAQNIAMPNGDRMGRYAAGPSSRKQFVRRGLTAKGAVKPSKSNFLSLIGAKRKLLFDPAGFGPNCFLVPVRHSDLLRVRTDAIQRQSNHRKEPAMGLDMYAFTTREDIPPVDFADPADTAKLFYWRKHPNLHGWMETLYRAKGGKDEQFNLAPVRLVVSDLDALEKAVRENALPETSGFCFGQSRAEEKNCDLKFICKARDAIASGKAVFYTSWW